jgi:hypothetical protein
MLKTASAKTASELEAINASIHDYWFDIAAVEYDRMANSLCIRFSRPGIGGAPAAAAPPKPIPTEWVLEICDVLDYSLEDLQRVGTYDFNDVRFSEPSNVLTITTGIPMRFEVSVRALNLNLYDTGRPV